MTGEVCFYRGLYKVKVLTESEGFFIVEALEDFEDYEDDKKVLVKAGERRIVPPESLHKQKTLPPMVQEHLYERKMEKKLERLVADEEAKEKNQKKP
jgi:Leu/Phe-tRNA-protein transferase